MKNYLADGQDGRKVQFAVALALYEKGCGIGYDITFKQTNEVSDVREPHELDIRCSTQVLSSYSEDGKHTKIAYDVAYISIKVDKYTTDRIHAAILKSPIVFVTEIHNLKLKH